MEMNVNEFLDVKVHLPESCGDINGNPEFAIAVMGVTTGTLSWVHASLVAKCEKYESFLRREMIIDRSHIGTFLSDAITAKLGEVTLQTVIGSVKDTWVPRQYEYRLISNPYAPAKVSIDKRTAFNYWDSDCFSGLHEMQFQLPTHPHLRIARLNNEGFVRDRTKSSTMPLGTTLISVRRGERRGETLRHYAIYALPTRYSGQSIPEFLGQYSTSTASAIRDVIRRDLNEKYPNESLTLYDCGVGLRETWLLTSELVVAEPAEPLIGGELDYIPTGSLTLVSGLDPEDREILITDIAERLIRCAGGKLNVLVVGGEAHIAGHLASMGDSVTVADLAPKCTMADLRTFIKDNVNPSVQSVIVINDLTEIVDIVDDQMSGKAMNQHVRQIREWANVANAVAVVGHALDPTARDVSIDKLQKGGYHLGCTWLENEADISIYVHRGEVKVGKWRHRPQCVIGLGVEKYFNCDASTLKQWLSEVNLEETPLLGYCGIVNDDANVEPAALIKSIVVTDKMWTSVKWEILDNESGRMLREHLRKQSYEIAPVVRTVKGKYVIERFEFTPR